MGFKSFIPPVLPNLLIRLVIPTPLIPTTVIPMNSVNSILIGLIGHQLII